MNVRRTAARGIHLGNRALYWVALVVSRAAGLLTLPVYARVLGAGDFGRYELLTSLLALLFSLLFVGMDFAMAVRYYQAPESKRRADLASALAVTGSLSVTAAIVIALASPALSTALLQQRDAAPAVMALAVALPCNVIASVQILVLRLEFRPGAFFLVTVPGVAFGSAVGVALVLLADAGLPGAMMGQAISYASMTVIGAALTRGRASLTDLTWRNTLAMVHLGLPLVPAGIAIWVFALSDRLLVSALVGFGQLGLYASAARIASLLSLVQGGFQLAWGPLALQWASATDRDARYRHSLHVVAKLGGASVVMVSLLSGPLITILAGPSYAEAQRAVWLLAGSVLLNALFYIVTIGLNLSQRSGRLATATALAAVANTALNLVLIPPLGYLGAAIATLAGYAISVGAGHLFSQRALPLRIGFAGGATWATAAIAAAAVVASAPVWLSLAVGIPAAGALAAGGLREAISLWRVSVEADPPAPPGPSRREATA